MNKYNISLIFFECLAFLISLIYWKKIKHNYFKFFSVYLGCIVLFETIGYLLMTFDFKEQNIVFIETIVIPTEFLFFFWLLSTLPNKKPMKYMDLICSFLYIATLLIEKGFKFQTQHLSISYTLGNVFLLIFLLNFFYNYIQSDKILSFKTDIMFYISVGLLIFYLGSFPFFVLKNYYWLQYEHLFTLYWKAMMIMNMLMYLLFSIGFICNKPKS